MDRWRVTSVEKFDYNFERSKNYRTLQRQRINWLPVVAIRRWVPANISNQYVKTLQNMTCKGALTSLDGGSGLFRSFRRRRDAGRITYNITAKIMKIIIMKKLSPTPWFGPLGTATRFEGLCFSENFRKLELNTYNRCTRCLCSKIGHCEAVH